MKKITVLALLIVSLLLPIGKAALASGNWLVQGTTAMETLTFPGGKGPVSLLLNYNQNNMCIPEVSMIVWSDRSQVLGNFIKRKSTTDKMVVTIDGQSFTGSITATKYSNALDASFVVTEQFVNRLKSGKQALVQLYNAPIVGFPLDGGADTIESARKNCR